MSDVKGGGFEVDGRVIEAPTSLVLREFDVSEMSEGDVGTLPCGF